MIRATISEVQSNLRGYLDQVARGETVEVTENEQPIAELRPTSRSRRGPRPVGLAKGQFEVPTGFFEPLPNDLLDAFNGDDE